MKANGSNITLPHINKSQVSFSVDEAKDSIVYGLKGISGIGDLEIELILKNRPYKNLSDFIEKLGKKEEKKAKKDKEEKKAKDEKATYISGTKIIALIKSGCFDELESKPREQILKEYVMQISEPNKSLKAVNIPRLMEWKLVPSEFSLEVSIYNFRKYTFSKQFFYEKDKDFTSKSWYKLNARSKKFFEEYFEVELEEDKDYKYNTSGDLLVLDTSFDKAYKKKIANLSEWLSSEEALEKFNQNKFLEVWEKYCQGTVSKWEMDTLNFYYNEHELANVNKQTYNLSDFFELDEKPTIENQWTDKKSKRKFNIYKLDRICGTVLDKDRNKHIVDILTQSGVVSVKFYGGTYTHYDKQLSVLDEKTGKKTVVEKSWFSRGSKLMIVGFRREDQFIPKKYKNSPFKHTVQKINAINNDGTVELQDERKQL